MHEGDTLTLILRPSAAAAVSGSLTYGPGPAQIASADLSADVGSGRPTTFSLLAADDHSLIEIPTVDNTVNDGARAFTVTIAAGTGYTVGTNGTVTVTILDDDPPAAPGSLEVTARDGGLDVSWAKPDGPVASYQVRHKTSSAPDLAATERDPSTGWVTATLRAHRMTVEITGLTPGTDYDVQVRARDISDGYGPWTATQSGTPSGTPPQNGLPGAPTELAVGPGDSELQVIWLAPSGTVTGYDVHYTSATESNVGNDASAMGSDASAAWVEVSRSGTLAAQTISSLTAGTAYRVRVRAKNAMGTSDWVHGTGTPVTQSDVPAAPTNLMVTPGDGKLELSWTEVPVPGAVLVLYEVQYTSAPSSGSGAVHDGDTADPALEDPAAGWVVWNLDLLTSRTISDLDNGTRYRVRVQASTTVLGAWAFGTGTPSDNDTDDDTNDDTTDDTTDTPTNTDGPGAGGAASPGNISSPDDGGSPRCGESDREDLERFYVASGGEGWNDNENWDSTEPLDQWFGVDKNEDGEVVSLRLADNGLSGEIPEELLLCLSELKELALWGNDDLSVDVPEELVLAVERAALRAIAEMFDINPLWFEDYEDPFNFEDWYEGVTTDDDGRVVELDLTAEGVIGEIPESITSQLRRLRETMITTSEGGCAVGASSERVGASGLLAAVFIMLLAVSRGFRARPSRLI